MFTAIILGIVVCSASALPPAHETPRDEGPSPLNNVDSELQAIIAVFEALKKLSHSTSGVQTEQDALLDKLRDIALAFTADKDLPQEERNRKYSAATFDVLEEYARAQCNGFEKDKFLAELALARRKGQSLIATIVPDKAAFIAFLRSLHDAAYEPFPGDKPDPLPDKDFEEFISELETALEHTTLLG